jgi:hypothetical protein
VLLADNKYRKQFNIPEVPYLMIMDKNGKHVYNGGVNYDKRAAYNIENMTDKLLE